jgi:hypothetical protein
MRRMILAFVILTATGLGTLATLRYLAAKPGPVATGSAGGPSTANMAPMEIMKERGKDLPATKNSDPF